MYLIDFTPSMPSLYCILFKYLAGVPVVGEAAARGPGGGGQVGTGAEGPCWWIVWGRSGVR